MGNFHDGTVVKSLPCNVGDTGLIPGGKTKIPHAVCCVRVLRQRNQKPLQQDTEKESYKPRHLVSLKKRRGPRIHSLSLPSYRFIMDLKKKESFIEVFWHTIFKVYHSLSFDITIHL